MIDKTHWTGPGVDPETDAERDRAGKATEGIYDGAAPDPQPEPSLEEKLRPRIQRALDKHLRITDDSEEWQGPCPVITNKGACVEAILHEVTQATRFKCKANRTADPPQDCDWPFCGCDDYASKVLEAVETIRDRRQGRMIAWGIEAFGREETLSVEQRGYRHAEEALEAAQSAGCVREKLHKLVDHICDREPGALNQEIGGSAITLLMLAGAAGLSVDAEEDREMKRVLAKPIEHFTARNAAKNAAGFVAASVAPVPARMFPILQSCQLRNPSKPKAVRWDFLQPYDHRAQLNHDQSLEQLASRGGLDWVEMYAIVMDMSWSAVGRMTEDEACRRVVELERKFFALKEAS